MSSNEWCVLYSPSDRSNRCQALESMIHIRLFSNIVFKLSVWYRFVYIIQMKKSLDPNFLLLVKLLLNTPVNAIDEVTLFARKPFTLGFQKSFQLVVL